MLDISTADIDECVMENDNCAEIFICTNTPGSFMCICEEGYVSNGTACVGKHVINT